jgi:O-antigen/teichoic acid export membrane protein
MNLLQTIRDAFSAGGQVLILRLLAMVLQFVFVGYITHNLGADVYGQFVAFLMITQLLGTIANLGTDTYLLKKIGASLGSTDFNNTAFLRQTLLLSTLSGLVIGLLGIKGIQAWNPNYLPSLSIWQYLAGVVLFACMRLITEYFRGIQLIVVSTLLGYIIAPSIALIGMWLVKMPPGEVSYVVNAWLIAMLVVLGYGHITNSLQSRQVLENPSLKLPKITEILSQSSPFLLATILVFMNEWVDKMMLNSYIPDATLAMYTVAYKLSLFVSMPLMAFNTLLASSVANSFGAAGNADHLRKQIKPILVYSLAIASLLYMLYILLGGYVLDLFGEGFSAVHVVLLILAFGNLVNVAAGPVGVVMKMTNLQNTYVKVVGFSVVLNIVLNLLLIPQFGIIGAAISSAVGLISVNLIAMRIIKRKLHISTGIIEI